MSNPLHNHFTFLLAFFVGATALLQQSQVRASDQPNVIVILVDDMGWSDLSCYGSEIPTPHLDALADNGIRYTQFYNTGRCCPTRACLLTGLYSHQTGVGHMTSDDKLPGYQGYLNDQCVTMGDVLRSTGYFTAACGKWHVGYNLAKPLDRGFDRFYGSQAGGFFFQPSKGKDVILNDKVLYDAGNPPPQGWYSTDAWTEYALKFIDEAQQADKPFFVYLAHNAPHFPLQAPQADIDQWKGKYMAGWDKLRSQRYQRQLNMGLIDESFVLSEKEEAVSDWDKLSNDEKERMDLIMAIYAAVMTRLDQSIGTLVSGLKARGEFENTLIVFMSDNGGNAEAGPMGRLEGDHPGDADSTVFCGQSWATLENNPFRKYKHYNHEGGISSPLIAHWPKGITSQKGTINKSTYGHLIDIMATVIDVSGANYPEVHNGKQILPYAGLSLVPTFSGEPIEREALFWEHEGNRAIRVGDMKLVALHNKPWELYNIKVDRSETQNLIEQQPELAVTLAQQWDAWAERSQVLPSPFFKNYQAGDGLPGQPIKTTSKADGPVKKKNTKKGKPKP